MDLCFCSQNLRILPSDLKCLCSSGFTADEFTWSGYLKLSKSASAPKNLFVNNATATVCSVYVLWYRSSLHISQFNTSGNVLELYLFAKSQYIKPVIIFAVCNTTRI